MSETTAVSVTGPSVWHLLPDRWRRTVRSTALSPLTERGYWYAARRWAQ